MVRTWVLRALLPVSIVTALSGTVFTAPQAPDPAALMRAAMGGDAALSAIQTLTIEGSASSLATEQRFAWPDRYTSISRQFIASPMGNRQMTQAHGVSGRNLIGWVESDFGANLPAYPDLVPGAPGYLWDKHVSEQRQTMARRTLLLFGPDAHSSATVTGTTDAVVDARAMHVLDLMVEGQAVHLAIDAATNLPASISWTAEAPTRTIVTTESMVTARGGQVVSERALGDPTIMPPKASGQQVEWVTTVDQFKTDKGITWPRRFVTTIAGKKTGEEKVTKYILNPKFGDDAFRLR
jgi:hypothetical protein